VFTKTVNGSISVVVILYVDDLVITGPRASDINSFEKVFKDRFEVSALNDLDVFIGIEVVRTPKGLALHQQAYINQILERFAMKDSSPVATPSSSMLVSAATPFDQGRYAEAIGSLNWLATTTRPDISYAVSFLAQAQASPTEEHWTGIKRIFRYLRGTSNLRLHYSSVPSTLQVFADADYASDPSDRRSRTGYVLIYAGAAISWRSKKQASVSLSTTEAELVSLSLAAQETLHIRRLLTSFGFPPKEPTVIHCDNQATIAVASNDAGTSTRLKHVSIRHFFVREAVQQKAISLKFVRSSENVSDVLTKGLPREQHVKLREMMGLSADQAPG
jgi:hypothetical protein